jgi:hypothetical protein
MPWTSQTVTFDVDVIEILKQLPEEAMVEYLESLGYQVNK